MTLPSLPANGIATSPNTVKSEWIDYNGHLNVAYYTMLFDWGIDAIKAVAGIDLDHIEREQRSTVALESRIAYLSEASLGDALRVDTANYRFRWQTCALLPGDVSRGRASGFIRNGVDQF